MNKNDFKKVTLDKGEMNVYDFGEIKLHAYKTNDFIDDEVFIAEKNGEAVIIEAPCFYDNIKELEKYLADNNIKCKALLLAYHMAGASFLKGVPVYATANADEYGHNGQGAGLIKNFTAAFGEIFDNSIFTVTNTIDEGTLTLCGIDFEITKTAEAFDIKIPELNAVYTHMLGHDCHSIVGGDAHADAIVNVLEDYLNEGVDLVLTSHYTPEDLKDVKAKIDYINDLKSIASICASADEFKSEVTKKYPDYSGNNYLEMTAGFFFA